MHRNASLSFRVLQIIHRVTAILLCVAVFPAAAESLRRGAFGEPESLEPRQSGVSSEKVLVRDLFEGLETYGPDGRMVPGAAESWVVSSDGLRYTFRLRAGLRWSDGAPLTAADFVFAMRRALAPATSATQAPKLYILKGARIVNEGRADPTTLGVRAMDPRTLQVDLEAPWPALPLLFAGEEGTPLPAHVIERYGKEWVKADHYVSNGPFALAERRPRGTIRLAKNPYFHDAAAVKLDEVRYVPSDDVNSLVSRFRAGELDVNGWPGFPASRAAALEQENPGTVRVSPLQSVRYLRFNIRHAPFDDVRVRKALSLLIDRDLLATRVLGGGESPAYRVVPAGLDADVYAGGESLAAGTAASRVAEARALLADAHFQERHPAPIRITLPTGNGTEACIAIASMWTHAGAPARLEQSEIKSMITDLRRGAFEVALTGAQDIPVVESYLERFETRSSYNTGGYANPVFDQLLATARQIPDSSARAIALGRAEERLVADHPTAPLYQEVARNLVSRRVLGWQDNPYDIHPSRYLALKAP